MKRINPADVHPPLGGYSHMISVPPGAGLLFLSGQVGVDRQGRVMEGVRGQTRQALANLVSCLEAAGMSVANVAKLTVYLTDAAGIPEMRDERRAVFGDADFPASTLVIVSGLAQPDLLVEVEAIAVG